MGPAKFIAPALAPKGSRSRAGEVVDLLFAHPIITVRLVQRALTVSQPGAQNLLKTLAGFEIVRQVGTGAGVRHRWFADGILQMLDPELAPADDKA